MITLKKIELHNFLSHEKTILKFAGNEKLLIDGKSGSGKSAIVDGLLWGLYGKGRAENRALIRKNAKSMKVIIALKNENFDRNDSTLYKIERSITKSGKHSIKIETADQTHTQTLETTDEMRELNYRLVEANGVKELQDYLEKEILQSSYTLFINSIVYPQESNDNFVNQTASKRKDIILEIAKAEQYDELYIKTREKINEINEYKLKMDGQISTLDSIISQDKELVPYISSWKKTEKNISEKLDRLKKTKDLLEDKLVILTEQIVIYNNKKEQKDKLKANLSIIQQTLNEDIKEYNTLKTENASENDIKDVAKLKESQKNASIWAEQMLDITKKRPIDHFYEVKVEELNTKFIKYSDLSNIEECPEIKKKCPILVKERKEQLAKITTDINLYQKLHACYIEEIEEHKTKIVELGKRPVFSAIELDMLELKIKSYEEVKLKKVELKTKIEATSKLLDATHRDINALNEEIAILTDKNAEATSVKFKIDTCTSEEDGVRPLLREVQEKLTLANAAKERVKKNESERTALKLTVKDKKEKLINLELLKEAFSSKGIKAIIIDFVIPRLEDKINEILHQLSDFTVRLDTQKSNISGDKNLEGLFITIYNEQGESFDFNNYSGGEKLKITVAITEALSEIQFTGFRILDELFIGLDEDSTEDFANILERLQGRFSQFFCISHLRNIKDLFQNKITAVKTNGVTKIE